MKAQHFLFHAKVAVGKGLEGKGMQVSGRNEARPGVVEVECAEQIHFTAALKEKVVPAQATLDSQTKKRTQLSRTENQPGKLISMSLNLIHSFAIC